ncbi:helix-turn-helix domain-containing protein [Nonomuraea sp. NPDC005983]|uniref:helix-turn-helix domain-containing protein n=1 Tax=Nonomuraea sp. NPDC005983 TaxID=3155595 RepID=UPI0033B69551
MLEALGLSGREEAAYQALLDHPAVTAAELRDLGASARTLAALQAKGLAVRLAGNPARYAAAPPQVALELLVRSREEELQRVRLDVLRLAERFRAAHRQDGPGGQDGVVETVEGPDAVRQRWNQIQRGARHEICVLDRPPYLTHANPVQPERHAQGVGYRVVYDTAALAVPGRLADIEAHIGQGEQARVASDVPVKMLLADDAVGMISRRRPAAADSVLIIHDSSLLTALRALFESVWNRASPYSRLTGTPGGRSPLGGDDGRLLTLLAAGMTDEAIARQLGWHPRTVQRRVRRLMDQLGVRTRFQAGMHAQREGWL